MAQLVVVPANPAITQGESVDLTVTVDTHADRLQFRDATTRSVTVVPSRAEAFSGWDLAVVSPLTKVLLESDGTHAIFRVTWP